MGIEYERRLLIVLNIFVTLARNLRLANGGADIYALGTNIALASVMPAESATSGFRYGENS